MPQNLCKMNMQNNIKVLSANCQGLRNYDKRHDILTHFKDMGANILCLQDTHLLKSDIPALKRLWKGEIFISGSRTNARGVVVLLNDNFEY